MRATKAAVHDYFVDEAGDTTLFSSRGRSLIGQEGVSHFFMIGAAYIPDPREATDKLEKVRSDLLKCPYFDVPSMRPEGKKTAIGFHACKDLPEVRWEVFQAIATTKPKVTIAIRRKKALAEVAEKEFQLTGKKISQHDIYDDLVKDTFKYLLHLGDEHRIVYAIRGKNPRAKAFESAIAGAKTIIEVERGESCGRTTRIQPARGSEFVGLQIIDYYLWAVQRLFERGRSDSSNTSKGITSRSWIWMTGGTVEMANSMGETIGWS